MSQSNLRAQAMSLQESGSQNSKTQLPFALKVKVTEARNSSEHGESVAVDHRDTNFKLPDTSAQVVRGPRLRSRVSQLIKRKSRKGAEAVPFVEPMGPLTPIKDGSLDKEPRLKAARPQIIARNSIEVAKARAAKLLSPARPKWFRSRSSLSTNSSNVTVYSAPGTHKRVADTTADGTTVLDDPKPSSIRFREHGKRVQIDTDQMIDNPDVNPCAASSGIDSECKDRHSGGSCLPELSFTPLRGQTPEAMKDLADVGKGDPQISASVDERWLRNAQMTPEVQLRRFISHPVCI